MLPLSAIYTEPLTPPSEFATDASRKDLLGEELRERELGLPSVEAARSLGVSTPSLHVALRSVARADVLALIAPLYQVRHARPVPVVRTTGHPPVLLPHICILTHQDE